jgi:hypothetical protein
MSSIEAIDAELDAWYQELRAWLLAQPDDSDVHDMDLHEQVEAYFAAQDAE